VEQECTYLNAAKSYLDLKCNKHISPVGWLSLLASEWHKFFFWDPHLEALIALEKIPKISLLRWGLRTCWLGEDKGDALGNSLGALLGWELCIWLGEDKGEALGNLLSALHWAENSELGSEKLKMMGDIWWQNKNTVERNKVRNSHSYQFLLQ
jgi:hypothetical protein